MKNVLVNFGVVSYLTFIISCSANHSSTSSNQDLTATPAKGHLEPSMKPAGSSEPVSPSKFLYSNKLYIQSGNIIIPFLSDKYKPPQFPPANGSRYFRYDENNVLIYVDKNDLTKAPKSLAYTKQLTALFDSPSGRYTLAISKETGDGTNIKSLAVIDVESMTVTQVNEKLIEPRFISPSDIRFSSDEKKVVILGANGAILDLETKMVISLENLPWDYYNNPRPTPFEPQHCFNYATEICKAFDIRFSKNNSQIEFLGVSKDGNGAALRYANWSVTTGKILDTRSVKKGIALYEFSVQFASENTAITHKFCADPCPVDFLKDNSLLDLTTGDALLSSMYTISYNAVTDLLFVNEGVSGHYTYRALNRSDLQEVWSVTESELAKTNYSNVWCRSDWIPFNVGMVCTTGLVTPPSGIQSFILENGKVSEYPGHSWNQSIMQKNSNEFAGFSFNYDDQTVDIEFFRFK